MPQWISGAEAIAKIRTGDHVCLIGNINLLEPETILHELEQSYITSGTPRDLTVSFPVFIGSEEGKGIDHLAHEGLVKRLIGGSYASMMPNRKMNELIVANQVEAYNIPMGSLYNLLRDTGAGKPGLVTGVGLNTFADPRYGGGKLNERTQEELCEVVKLNGGEWLFYPRLKVNVAIIRATSADELGNLSLEKEPTSQGILAIAMAARNNGGIVIAQVRRKIARGSIHPKMVTVPSKLVDYLVLDERDEAIVQSHPGSVMGEFRQPIETRRPIPLDHRKVIMRRALFEFRQGDFVNLGFGIPAGLPAVAHEENLLDDIRFTIEHGPIGGVPGWTGVFGVSMNPDLILDSTQVFDLYDGGLLDMTCLGMGEVDRFGNVNNHKFKHIIAGTGGFNDIIYATPKIVLAGTFTVGGLKTEIRDGKLIIVQEGKFRKFNREIEGITLNAKEALGKKQRVMYVTERAVFELSEDGLVLTEAAPGIDVESQILGLLDFPVAVSPELRTMNPRIFRPEPMRVRLTRTGCECV
ncbi:MAG TPA: CoA-transferase [Bacilli bacterium]